MPVYEKITAQRWTRCYGVNKAEVGVLNGILYLLIVVCITLRYELQYSPFITSHMCGIFSVAPRNFFRDKTENYTWHGQLPHVEKGFAMPRNSHAWQSKPLPRVANIRAMSHTVTHVEEIYYTCCFEAYVYSIINWHFVITVW